MGSLAYYPQQESSDITYPPKGKNGVIKLPIGYKRIMKQNHSNFTDNTDYDYDDKDSSEIDQEFLYYQRTISPFLKLEELIYHFQDLSSFVFHPDFDYFISCWIEYQYYILLSKDPMCRPKVLAWLISSSRHLVSVIDYYSPLSSTTTMLNTNEKGKDQESKWDNLELSTFHVCWAFKRLLNRIQITYKLIIMIDNGRCLNQTPQMVMIPLYKDILNQCLGQQQQQQQMESLITSLEELSPTPPQLSYYSSAASSSFSTPMQTPFILDNTTYPTTIYSNEDSNSNNNNNNNNNMNPFENQFHHVISSSSSSSSSSTFSSPTPASSPLSPHSYYSSLSPPSSLPYSSLRSYSCPEVMPYLNDSYSNMISYVHPISVMLPQTSSTSSTINYMNCDQPANVISTYPCFYSSPIRQIQNNNNNNNNNNSNSNSNQYHQHNSMKMNHEYSFDVLFYPKEVIQDVIEEEQEAGEDMNSLTTTPIHTNCHPYYQDIYTKVKDRKAISQHQEEKVVEVEEEKEGDEEEQEEEEEDDDDDDHANDKDYQDNESTTNEEEEEEEEDDHSYIQKKEPIKKERCHYQQQQQQQNHHTNTTIMTTTTLTKKKDVTNTDNNAAIISTIRYRQQQRQQRRRGRTATSYDTETTRYLKRVFFTVYSQRDKLTKEQRKEVQQHTQLQPRNITYWFSNHKRRFQKSLELYKRVLAESNGAIQNYEDYLNWRREQGLPEED
ncbi:unnamed protein product [Cunninghamella echinulata]